jgi:hypothetical protein
MNVFKVNNILNNKLFNNKINLRLCSLRQTRTADLYIISVAL